MYNIIKNEISRLSIAFILIISGVLGRLYLVNFLPNAPSFMFTLNGVTQPIFMMDLFFIVAVIAILTGLLLGGIYSIFVPISVLAITDVILGNSYIFLFTWSGFIILALVGYILKNKNRLTFKSTPSTLGFSLLGVLFYDLWTNFGCWLGWYPHNLNGLILCYTVSIPFMLWHLLSTAIVLTMILIPLTLLKEKEMIKFDFIINPLEKHLTTILMSFLIVLTIFSVIL